MKNTWLILLVGLLMATAQAQDMRVYTKDGVSIVYPASMTILDLSKTNPGAWAVLRDPQKTPKNTVLFFSATQATQSTTALQYAQASRQDTTRIAAGSISEPKIEKIGTQGYYTMTYQTMIRNSPQQCKAYVAFDPKTRTGYVWTLNGSPDKFKADLPNFEQVLSTSTYPGGFVPSP